MLMAGAITQTPTPPWNFCLQDITENGCAPTTEEQLPKTAPSPLVEAKDPKFREDRRPITVHFGPGPRQAEPGAQLHCAALRGARAVPHRGPGGKEQGEDRALPCVTCESKCGGVTARVQKHPLCSLPTRTSSRGPGSPLGPTFLRSLLLRHNLPGNNPPHTASPDLQVQTWAGPPGAPVTGPAAPPNPPALTRCPVLSP